SRGVSSRRDRGTAKRPKGCRNGRCADEITDRNRMVLLALKEPFAARRWLERWFLGGGSGRSEARGFPRVSVEFGGGRLAFWWWPIAHHRPVGCASQAPMQRNMVKPRENLSSFFIRPAHFFCPGSTGNLFCPGDDALARLAPAA